MRTVILSSLRNLKEKLNKLETQNLLNKDSMPNSFGDQHYYPTEHLLLNNSTQPNRIDTHNSEQFSQSNPNEILYNTNLDEKPNQTEKRIQELEKRLDKMKKIVMNEDNKRIASPENFKTNKNNNSLINDFEKETANLFTRRHSNVSMEKETLNSDKNQKQLPFKYYDSNQHRYQTTNKVFFI
jgi:hypothetical protein